MHLQDLLPVKGRTISLLMEPCIDAATPCVTVSRNMQEKMYVVLLSMVAPMVAYLEVMS